MSESSKLPLLNADTVADALHGMVDNLKPMLRASLPREWAPTMRVQIRTRSGETVSLVCGVEFWSDGTDEDKPEGGTDGG